MNHGPDHRRDSPPGAEPGRRRVSFTGVHLLAPQLRIGVLVDQFPELSETFIAAELHELRRAGHHVRVEAERHASHPNPDAAAELTVSYLEDDGRPRKIAALIWLIGRHPVRSLSDLLSRRRWRREEDVRRLRALAPAARRLSHFRAQHLHAHFAAGAALDALRLGQLLDLPFSVATHGYDIFQIPRNLTEKHERAAFAVSACEYSVRHIRSQLQPQHAARVHKLVVGVDGDRFRRRAPHVNHGTVLTVGRLVEKKGLRHLIEAGVLLADDPAFERLVLAGDGPLRRELAEQARSLGISDRVEFLGPRTPAQVRDLLEAAAVVAIPCVVASDGDRDTMPVIAKEALAMEVPVVASDAVGLPEVIAPQWGRLVPPRDPGALASALLELLHLPLAQRAEMGRAGRCHVLETCSLSGETRRLADLIALRGPR